MTLIPPMCVAAANCWKIKFERSNPFVWGSRSLELASRVDVRGRPRSVWRIVALHMRRDKLTHIHPPADTKPTNEVSKKYGKEAVDGPIMGDAPVAQVVNGEDKLMPQKAQEDSACHKPGLGVGIRGDGG